MEKLKDLLTPDIFTILSLTDRSLDIEAYQLMEQRSILIGIKFEKMIKKIENRLKADEDSMGIWPGNI